MAIKLSRTDTVIPEKDAMSQNAFGPTLLNPA